MKIMRNEDGQTLIFTALLMCVLVGFMAVAIDVGVIFHTQRNIQSAADAAATAAAVSSVYTAYASSSSCGSSVDTVTCAAYTAAAHNGVTDPTQVSVNPAPVNGWHTGNGYVEVIIRRPTIVPFIGTFSGLNSGSGGGASYNPMTIGARSVAGLVPAQDCIYALDKHANDAFDVKGNANVSLPNCAVQINSDSQQALCTTGQATVTSIEIDIAGAQNTSSNCNGTQSNAVTGVQQVSDPLAPFQWPTCDSNNTITNTTINSTTTLKTEQQTNPSGATVNVHCFSGSNVTIASGTTLGTATTTTDAQGNPIVVGSNDVYVFEHGVTIGGAVTVNGTLDNAGGTFTQGNSALTINAPADLNDMYNGLALIVDPTNLSNTCAGSYSSFKGDPAPGGCLQIQFGSGYGNLDGMIYAPNTAIYMQDNGGGSVVTAIIADEVYDKSSNLEITDSYSHAHPNTSPLNHIALVE